MFCLGTAHPYPCYDGSIKRQGAVNMPHREAPLRIVPRVFCEDGGGYARPSKCVLCGLAINKRSLAWGRLVSDPDGVRRPVHTTCTREYSLFCTALDI